MLCSIVPIYLGEISPAKWRGSFVNTYQFVLLFGGLIAVSVNYAMNQRTDQWAYRLILILQFVIPVIMIVGGFILPESPRWLISQGREQQAVRVLKYLRKGTPDAVIEKEAQLIGASVEEQKLLHNDTSYLDCFR